MYPIASITAPNSTTYGQVEFANIPQNFTHLQLRVFARSTASGTSTIGNGMIFNGLANPNTYNSHSLNGDGSSATSSAAGYYNILQYSPYLPASGANSNVFGVQIWDILDYTNTNKNKTVRCIGGFDNNGSGNVALTSGLWLNTSAITDIILNVSGTYFAQYSTFQLYGITTA